MFNKDDIPGVVWNMAHDLALLGVWVEQWKTAIQMQNDAIREKDSSVGVQYVRHIASYNYKIRNE